MFALAPPFAHASSIKLRDAPSLYEQRVGVSENEPNYCDTEVVRDTNPNAANRDSIEIGPPKFLVENLGASRVWRHCILILNRFDEPRTIELSTVDVLGSPDPAVTLETRDTPSGAGSWIEPLVSRLELDPGERAIVPYLVRLPETLPGGTVGGGIRVTDTTDLDREGGDARLTRSLVSQLQITSPGGEAKDLDIGSINSTRLIWTGRDPSVIRATFTVRNRGTILDTMTPRLAVDGPFGREVADIVGLPDVVLPDSAQRVTLRWTGVPFIGVYFPKLRIASATGTTTTDLPMVIVLPPWPYILAVGAALLLLVAGWFRRRRRAWQMYLDDEYEDEYEDDVPYEVEEHPIR